MDTRTDSELVGLYADATDGSAFEELVRRHRQMVYRTCIRMLGNPQEAEDAAQATFVVLVKKAGILRWEGNLGGWLHRVARNVALEALRLRADIARRQEESAMWQESLTSTQDETVDKEHALSQLDAELNKLSSVLKEAVILRYLEGHSERDAAELAGCPVGTMKWRLSEGIARLRTRLARRDVALSVSALAGVLEAESQATIPETLLSSIMTAAKMSATGVAAGAGTGGTTMMLAKGAMKAMFWAKVKMAAATAGSVAVAVSVWTLVVAQVIGHDNNGSDLQSIGEKGADTMIHLSAGIIWGNATNGLQAGLRVESDEHRQHVIRFIRNLSDAVNKGNTMVRSLELCAERAATAEMKEAITQLRADIIAGSSLAEAMQKQPTIFEKNHVEKIKEGESRRQVDLAIADLGDSLGKNVVIRQGEAIRMEVSVRNVGERQLRICDGVCEYEWRPLFDPLKTGDQLIRSHAPLSHDSRDLVLEKSEHRILTVSANKFALLKDPQAEIPLLPTGRYTVSVRYIYVQNSSRPAGSYWTGELITGSVEIEITPGRVSLDADAGRSAARFGEVLAQMALLNVKSAAGNTDADTRQVEALIGEYRQLASLPEMMSPSVETWRVGTVAFLSKLGINVPAERVDKLAALCAKLKNKDTAVVARMDRGKFMMEVSDNVWEFYTNAVKLLDDKNRREVERLLVAKRLEGLE